MRVYDIPAFPLKEPLPSDNEGMTLRDYFAAKALQGLLAFPDSEGSRQEFAAEAYAFADAMLEARQK